MLTASLTVGVVVSILLTELIGLSPGGIIVPGYVALILDRPAALLGLLLLTGATYWTVRLLARFVFLYGSRRFGMMVLVGLAYSVGAQLLRVNVQLTAIEWVGLGFVVPGLLAHQWDRQGVLPTMLMLAVAAPLVRLITLLVVR